MTATANRYLNLNEQQLLTIWNIYFDMHEEAYLRNDTDGCVEASKVMDEVQDVLYDKFQYTAEDFRGMYNQYKAL